MYPNQITRTKFKDAEERKQDLADRQALTRRAERSFYPKSDVEIRLREQAHTEYSRSRPEGQAFNVHDRDRHADQVVASMAPVLREANLTGQEVVELRRAMTLPALT